ncbi:MAG: hypothetical protein V9G04_04465 [Nocardioides sp.]|jgi:hypothetical protein
MYDMYPDAWGPAAHNPDNPYSYESVQARLDARDASAPRPDDN